ncbi:hypothetical protein [Mycoplasmopsis edwardii]|uniref:Uncharacterized protein n=1 Tax=Mycoplasmopsis edwardii TaxID=53558 RepID=A0ACD4PJ10_9BACT|nr:hypothetical protein [Mycoplasmopsis edwardii]WBP84108.1 hypothetical protein Me_995_000058 [Mycoplasmopsis edwardii]
MTTNHKVKIYIDFEAITFNYLSRIDYHLFFTKKDKLIELPFYFTIGYFKDPINYKFFRTYSSAFDLKPIQKNRDINEFWAGVRKELIKGIKTLLKDDEFVINENTVEFYSWNTTLETPILMKSLGIPSNDLAGGDQIGLDRLIPKNKFTKNHFEGLHSDLFNQRLGRYKISEGDAGGKIAAIVGALALINGNKHYLTKSKFKGAIHRIIMDHLLNCVRKYNKDDVLKLAYVEKNQEQTKQLIKKFHERRWIRDKYAGNISKCHALLSKIDQVLEYVNFDKNKYMNEIVEFVGSKINDLTELSRYQSSFNFDEDLNFWKNIKKNFVSNTDFNNWTNWKTYDKTIDQIIQILENKIDEETKKYEIASELTQDLFKDE